MSDYRLKHAKTNPKVGFAQPFADYDGLIIYLCRREAGSEFSRPDA